MRFARLSLLLALLAGSLVWLTAAWAQDEELALRQLPYSAAYEIAEQAYQSVATSGGLPDDFRVANENGRAEQVTAAQALGLLAAAAEATAADDSGNLALLPATIGAPVAFDESAAQPNLAVPTSELLAQGRPTLDFTAMLGAFPSAIWVNGQRLSATEYFAALASLFKYQARTERLPEKVQITRCGAPSSWTAATIRSAKELPKGLPPANLAPTVAVAPTIPKLELYPGAGAKLCGLTDFVAAYGPTETRVIVSFCLDGQLKISTDCAPFSLRLDTSQLTPGSHKLRVEVEDLTGGGTLASKEINFTVVQPKPASPVDAGQTAPQVQQTQAANNRFRQRRGSPSRAIKRDTTQCAPL